MENKILKRRDAEASEFWSAAVVKDPAAAWELFRVGCGWCFAHSRAPFLLLILTLLNAGAQSADDFFHGGAQQFLTNNIKDALLTVTNGLQQFPDDTKLKKLWELLNQQQQSQSQEQKEQQEQKQDQKDQGEQKDQKDQSQQSKDEQQKKEDEQKQQQAKKDSDQQKDEQKNKSGKPEKSDEQKQAEAQAMQAHAMTPQEAKQLLDAQKDKEQVLIFKPQEDPKKAKLKPVKDW